MTYGACKCPPGTGQESLNLKMGLQEGGIPDDTSVIR